MKTFFKIFGALLTGILLLCCHLSYGQSDQQTSLSKLTASSDSINSKFGAEKLYIQFDKPYYAISDTIWLKAYLLNVPTQLLSARSGLLHVDIANDSNKIVKQYLLPVAKGLSWGNIALDEKIFKPGDYTIRAYTNWMRNFGEETFFYKSIRVAGTDENGWLVNSKINNDGAKVNAQLQLMAMDKRPLADSALQVELTDGKKVVSRQNVQTDKNGLVGLNFSPKAGIGKSTIVLQNRNKTKKALIPVMLNRPENTDVQFMPEGGGLVASLPGRIGFKAIGENGRGVAISGVVVDHRDSIITSFQTLHNGMGSFYIQPQASEIYTAKVTLLGGLIKSYPLPAVRSSGTLLQVKNLPGHDSLEVAIASTADLADVPYYLVAKARGITCYAAIADLSKESFMRSRIAKSKFPGGIAHFILMTAAGQPLNERLVYIDRPDSLHISIDPAQYVYGPKDSIALHISVNDKSGKPVIGNFSMSVTDDAQVHGDTLDNDNIITRMLLTSELKGYIENPSYYFMGNDTARQALDNLLLTQGWVNYEPKTDMPFKAENEYEVSGRVNIVFNKAIKKTEMVLLSTRPQIVMDTVTDKNGRFVFEHFPRVDTPVFVIKTNKRDFNVNIDIDETVPPVFNAPKIPLLMPWYVNTDTTLMNYVKQNTLMKQQPPFPGSGRLLKEVQIKAKKVVKGSYNLNGPGNADVVLDEKQLENSGKKNWRKLFEENIRGFREVDSFALVNNIYVLHQNFYVHEKPVVLLVDGVIVSTLFNRWDFRQFIEFHDAEDIKGIEVITSTKYTAHYMRVFFPQAPLDSCVFVEVTTRSGNPLIKNTPGLYLYKPLAISWPKQFYKPKYMVKDTSKQVDLRSTIDWEPNLTTDTAGRATVSFYAGSAASIYTVIMEGVDLNGNIGYKRRKISIIAPKESTKSK